MLRCAQSPRVKVLLMYASARRFFARLASGSFWAACKRLFFSDLLEIIKHCERNRRLGIYVQAAIFSANPREKR
jgi:hypothetical protein